MNYQTLIPDLKTVFVKLKATKHTHASSSATQEFSPNPLL